MSWVLEKKFGWPIICPKILHYVNNKNDTTHRIKIFHLTERTLTFYLFHKDFDLDSEHIHEGHSFFPIGFMGGKKLKSFECMLRKVGAIRIYLLYFFNKQNPCFPWKNTKEKILFYSWFLFSPRSKNKDEMKMYTAKPFEFLMTGFSLARNLYCF